MFITARVSSTCKRTYLLGCTIFLACAGAWAQRDARPIDWNTNWDFGVWVAGSTGEETTNSWAQVQLLTAGIYGGNVFTDEIGSGWHRGRFEYGFEVVPLFVSLGNKNIYGGGFDPVIIRWNSSLHTSRVAPYIELAGGCVAATANLPPGRTSSFNFTAKGGGGVYLFTRNRRAVDIGLQWSHISNANLGFWNPEFNGLQLRLGYHWYK